MSGQQVSKSARMWSMAMLPARFRERILKHLADEEESIVSQGGGKKLDDLLDAGQIRSETEDVTLKHKGSVPPEVESKPSQFKSETELATSKHEDSEFVEAGSKPNELNSETTHLAALKYQSSESQTVHGEHIEEETGGSIATKPYSQQSDTKQTNKTFAKEDIKIKKEVQPVVTLPADSTPHIEKYEVKPEEKKEAKAPPPSLPLVGDELECLFLSGDEMENPVAYKLLVTAIVDPMKGGESITKIPNPYAMISIQSLTADVIKLFNFKEGVKNKLINLSKACDNISSSEQVVMTKPKFTREFLLDQRFLPVCMQRPANMKRLIIVNQNCCPVPDPDVSGDHFLAMPKYRDTTTVYTKPTNYISKEGHAYNKDKEYNNFSGNNNNQLIKSPLKEKMFPDNPLASN